MLLLTAGLSSISTDDAASRAYSRWYSVTVTIMYLAMEAGLPVCDCLEVHHEL